MSRSKRTQHLAAQLRQSAEDARRNKERRAELSAECQSLGISPGPAGNFQNPRAIGMLHTLTRAVALLVLTVGMQRSFELNLRPDDPNGNALQQRAAGGSTIWRLIMG